MAEALAAIGAVASIVQLADFGFKLSIKLFAFGEAVANADRSVKSLANEISLTAAVLKELSEVLKSNESHVSPRAIEATQKTIQECFDAFDELSKALEKSIGDVSVSKDGIERKKIKKLEKIKWSFFQPRMDLLRSNLDRSKSSLTLMLQVLTYAENIKKQKAVTQLDYQKTAIQALAKSAKDADNKYQILQKAIKNAPDDVVDDREAFRQAMRGQADAQMADHEALSRATTFVARSLISDDEVVSTASNPRATTRSADASEVEQAKVEHISERIDSGTASSFETQPLVGELILCFNLVHNLLSYHLGIATNPAAYKTYLNLRRSVESAHEAELEILEKQYGDTAYMIGAEAAKNAMLLQKRLRELAKQKHGDLTGKLPAAKSPHEISESPYLNPASASLGSASPMLSAPDVPADLLKEEIDSFATSSEARLNHVSPPHSPLLLPGEGKTLSDLPEIRKDIDDTVGIMRENISKIEDRGERLDSLRDKTDHLAISARGFRRGANRVNSGRSRSWYAGLASSAGNVIESVSTGAQVVAGGISIAGSSIANAFSGPQDILDQGKSPSSVLHDLRSYKESIQRLDDLQIGALMCKNDEEEEDHDDHDEDEDEDRDDQYDSDDIVDALLSEWTTLGHPDL